MDSDDALMLNAIAAGIAACTMEMDHKSSNTIPQQKFIRPLLGYMDFLALQNELPHEGDPLYRDQVRLSKEAVDLVVKLSRSYIPKSLEAKTVIMVTLQWLASGASARCQEQLFQDHNHVTVSRYRQIGIAAILKAMVDGGFYGSNPHESDCVVSSSHVFANEYPMLYKCIGALDGTNIPLVVNLDMQHRFRNRKGQTTTNAMGVVDETGRFLALFVGAEGCASDSFVFNMSNFERLIPDGHFYLGDAGYRLSPFLLTPYRNQRYHLREWAPNPDGRPKSAKELFNYRHSKARIVVERAFGIMKIKLCN
ncbi:hypothetical protein AeMF1_013990 [Aphanomyces euteiches]|nr:hypothetical protein AeMF1_013990 [Aphanomyces euteiches]